MKQTILDSIQVKGYYCYRPDLWNEEIDSIISLLIKEGKIETLTDAGIFYMNGDYIYIEKGNPRFIKVETEGNYQMLSI